MSTRHAWSVAGAAVLSCSLVFAQVQDEQSDSTVQIRNDAETARAVDQIDDTADAPITLVGCLMRESDYRAQFDRGRGGLVGTGLGLRNEYVLIGASQASAAGSASTAGDCTSATGDAYDLSGDREDELEAFVGRRIEISGTRKHAALDDNQPVGTSGTSSTQVSGGFDPLGQDLQLREVNVESFREATVMAAAEPAVVDIEQQTTTVDIEQQELAVDSELQADIQQQPVGTSGRADVPITDVAEDQLDQPLGLPRAAEDQPVGTTGMQATAAEDLPGTASPLPLAGLLGLLSLVGAFGVRRLR